MTVRSHADTIREALRPMTETGSPARVDPPNWVREQAHEALAALAALEAEHQQLRKALMRIEANKTVPGEAGVIRGDAAKIARDALRAVPAEPGRQP